MRQHKYSDTSLTPLCQRGAGRISGHGGQVNPPVPPFVKRGWRGDVTKGGNEHAKISAQVLRCLVTACCAMLWVLHGASLVAPPTSLAHPLGNFSISRYAGLRLTQQAIELRYLLDMAEIPTFLELQESGMVPEVGHPSLREYLDRQSVRLQEGLHLEVNGQRLPLQGVTSEIVFLPGAGDLPTLKLGIVYRASLEVPCVDAPCHLHYRDSNFPGRLGWQEVIAVAEPGIIVAQSSVPAPDRSRALTDYPAELLSNPPQVLEAEVHFRRESTAHAASTAAAPPSLTGQTRGAGTSLTTPRSALTELVTTQQLSPGMIGLALIVAVGLGALHALEPGHGKTVVAAYLAGSRGTPRHALYLGLIVTATHTAGVYLLGAVTLYLSHYVVPERLYPWLGGVSGLLITCLGCGLLARRYVGASQVHTHDHSHAHHHSHLHTHTHHHGTIDHEHPAPHEGSPAQSLVEETMSFRALLALGVTGGIVPCPAALVVLLSAIALQRVGFGLLLIVAFSAGLAGVLMMLGLLMVSARHVIARVQGEGRLMTRWLPLTSAAVITVFGLVMLAQALLTAGVVQIRL
jgi:nickel/cobalt exporter